jgi:hypothetical protein
MQLHSNYFEQEKWTTETIHFWHEILFSKNILEDKSMEFTEWHPLLSWTILKFCAKYISNVGASKKWLAKMSVQN